MAPTDKNYIDISIISLYRVRTRDANVGQIDTLRGPRHPSDRRRVSEMYIYLDTMFCNTVMFSSGYRPGFDSG